MCTNLGTNDAKNPSLEERFLLAIFGEQSSQGIPADPAALTANIDKMLALLTYREREIIKLRYGLADHHTYTSEEVGRIFKVSRERIRQIEGHALRKINTDVHSRHLAGFLPDQLPPVEDK